MLNSFAGASLQATGTITANTASLLTFGSVAGQLRTRSYVIVSNVGSNIAYFKINDSVTAPAVSPTNYDAAIPPSTAFVSLFFNAGIRIESVSVYTANVAGAGVNVVGW